MASLVTEARARRHAQLLGADATLLAALLTAASDSVERYCGRVFLSAERTETYSGLGTNILFLRCYPVASVATIKWLDDDAVETEITTGNRVNLRTGELRLTEEYFPCGFENIKVKYTAGWTTIPEAVQEAVVQIVAQLYADGLQDASVASEKLGEYSYQRQVWEGFGGSIRNLLAPYRDMRV